ncbi:MAG: hypothetical protein ACOC0U_03635 [Desulfovibrionales bacterium]
MKKKVPVSVNKQVKAVVSNPAHDAGYEEWIRAARLVSEAKAKDLWKLENAAKKTSTHTQSARSEPGSAQHLPV